MEQKRRKIEKGKVENQKREGRKSKKGRWKIENGRRKSCKMRRGLFFPFFFFFFFLVHFSKLLQFVLGLPKWGIFYREKTFHAGGKKSGKMILPLWKIFLFRSWTRLSFSLHQMKAAAWKSPGIVTSLFICLFVFMKELMKKIQICFEVNPLFHFRALWQLFNLAICLIWNMELDTISLAC